MARNLGELRCAIVRQIDSNEVTETLSRIHDRALGESPDAKFLGVSRNMLIRTIADALELMKRQQEQIDALTRVTSDIDVSYLIWQAHNRKNGEEADRNMKKAMWEVDHTNWENESRNG